MEGWGRIVHIHQGLSYADESSQVTATYGLLWGVWARARPQPLLPVKRSFLGRMGGVGIR
jgi:hypothetical protein